MPKFRRSYIAATHDLFMAALSFPLALYLRLGGSFLAYSQHYLPWAEASFVLVFALVAFGFKLQRGVWRFVSIRELLLIARVAVISIVAFYLLLFLALRLEGVPRSVPFIHLMLLGGMLAGSRLCYRIWRDRTGGARANPHAIPVLLVGYKQSAEQFVRDLQRTPDALYRVVGLIDNDKASHGRMLHGVQILGGVNDMERITRRLEEDGHRPQRVILSEDYLEPEKVNALLEACERLGLRLSRLPKLTDFHEGDASKAFLRPVAIEDILGRAQHAHDKTAMRDLIAGKTVLVTGAGGTIGGELSRQAASFAPSRLVLLDASEYNLYQIDHEIERLAPQVERSALLGDVRDAALMKHYFETYQPDIVFHAAAIKHVPLSEANAAQAALTNIFGTKAVADAASACKVGTLVLISTDKAVNPTNVMGASKRLAERYCQISAARAPATRFVAVRFGNVLGSTGSVVPLFQKQLEAGGPLTVTHPDMERFFMTVREAVELVISAAALAQDIQPVEGKGYVFVLDMGKPVKIRDLALQMIRLAGLKPETDIKIVYTGLRPGEKLYEELFYGSEEILRTPLEGVMLAKTGQPEREVLERGLTMLYEACKTQDAAQVRRELKKLLPEYTPEEKEAKEGHDHEKNHHRAAFRIGQNGA